MGDNDTARKDVVLVDPPRPWGELSESEIDDIGRALYAKLSAQRDETKKQR